jgi:hypothetical protein
MYAPFRQRSICSAKGYPEPALRMAREENEYVARSIGTHHFSGPCFYKEYVEFRSQALQNRTIGIRYLGHKRSEAGHSLRRTRPPTRSHCVSHNRCTPLYSFLSDSRSLPRLVILTLAKTSLRRGHVSTWLDSIEFCHRAIGSSHVSISG